MVLRLMLRGCLHEDKRISTIYILPDISRMLRGLLINFARLRKLDVRLWGTQQRKAENSDFLPVNVEGSASDASNRYRNFST